MCARFSLTSPIDAIRQLFNFTERPNLAASYNIAPTTFIPAVRAGRTGDQIDRHLFFAHWGLIPSWAKDKSQAAKLINARSETVDTKPSFKHAFKHHRCLIPCNGYFEWKTTSDGSKQPYRIFRTDTPLFALAGIWEEWTNADNQHLLSCSLLTKPAHPNLLDIHHRMPVMVSPDHFDDWLTGTTRGSLPDQELDGYLSHHPVNPAIGNVRNNTPDLIKETLFQNRPEQRSLF